MTYKIVKFQTAKGEGSDTYHVAFCGDDRYFQKLEVHVSADLGSDALDYVELFGIWFFMLHLETAGTARTAKNLKLVVSRGAIKRLLRETSSKSHLFNYTNAIRTQFFGLQSIEVEKSTAWADEIPCTISVRWDGNPPPYPEVINPIVGPVGVSYHAVERYFEQTNREGRTDQVFQKVCRLLRDADREAILPPKVQKHKTSIYGDEEQKARYLNTPAGWQAVVVLPPDAKPLLITVYQRNGF